MVFAKIKFSRNFPDLQYVKTNVWHQEQGNINKVLGINMYYLYLQVNEIVSLESKNRLTDTTLVNVNALVVATTSWWLHFSAPVVA